MVGLRRTTFEVSRASEYFDERELQAQTGQPAHNFITVALKELLDNALDACEGVGVAPEIGVEAREEHDNIRLRVSDNGPGLLPETVRKVLDFNFRVSDKALYRTPSRGQQGNALKTVVAMPFAMGDPNPFVAIRARGREHRIRAALGAGGFPDVDYRVFPCATEPGTVAEVRLPLPSWPSHVRRLMDMTRSYHLCNPHAKVSFRASRPGVEHW